MKYWAIKIAQSGRSLHRRKDQGSIPKTHVLKSQVLVILGCFPSVGEAETGGSLGVAGQPAEGLSEHQSNERLYQNTRWGAGKEWYPR